MLLSEFRLDFCIIYLASKGSSIFSQLSLANFSTRKSSNNRSKLGHFFFRALIVTNSVSVVPPFDYLRGPSPEYWLYFPDSISHDPRTWHWLPSPPVNHHLDWLSSPFSHAHCPCFAETNITEHSFCYYCLDCVWPGLFPCCLLLAASLLLLISACVTHCDCLLPSQTSACYIFSS